MEQSLIVTLKSLTNAAKAAPSPLESVQDPASPDVAALYQHAVELLGRETDKAGANVMITVSDRAVSMLQSRLAETGTAGMPLEPGGLEAMFGEGATGGDLWGWFRSLFDHVSPSKWHAIVRPADTTATPFPARGRIAVMSDWGTNLYGAPASAASIARVGGYEMLLHLGDIYYSGTESEVQQRFLAPWPRTAGRISRALNGNHEMYSGGFAYFDHVLPSFDQASSYFAFQNAHWLLVGLDTAHADHDLDTQQTAWLNAVVAGAHGRKLILFSHHQPFSRLDAQGPKLQAALANLLTARAITAWYWGHEHDCVIYDAHAQFGLLGRCIGHGGIPSPRKPAVRQAPTERAMSPVAWKRLTATADAPSCLVLDGPNPLVPGEEDKFGPHGYLTLDFADASLTEHVHLPDGTEIWRAQVA